MKQVKQEQEYDTCEIRIQQDFIIKKLKNRTKLWQENIPKTNVEHIESNEEFYFYLYSLGT